MDREDRVGAGVKVWLLLALLWGGSLKAEALPEGFVRLSDLAPDIAQDIRYARSFNFTGAPVPGYAAAECILVARTADALIRVEQRLNASGYGLIVYDCYRPQRAVAHFVAWADGRGAAGLGSAGLGAADLGAVFFPDLRREDLFAEGYVARRSSHSLGVTVDAGLRRLGDPVLRPVASEARCDAGFDLRVRETAVDMGTGFDCFSPLSGLGAAVGAVATANRARLTAAMQAEGFKGYASEWWHFRNAADPADTPMDFVIE